MSPNDIEFLWHAAPRLLLALVLGAAVGIERETKNKPAGLRTIILITFASALFTLLSEALALGRGADPTRISAQLLTGVGFLGAGAIIQSRGAVTGLTTAATIFAMAAIGMASGGGLFRLATLSTLLLLAVLVVIGWIEGRTERRRQLFSYALTTRQSDRCIADLLEFGRREHVMIRDFRVFHTAEHFRVEFSVEAFQGSEVEVVRQIQQIQDTHG